MILKAPTFAKRAVTTCGIAELVNVAQKRGTHVKFPSRVPSRDAIIFKRMISMATWSVLCVMAENMKRTTRKCVMSGPAAICKSRGDIVNNTQRKLKNGLLNVPSVEWKIKLRFMRFADVSILVNIFVL